MEERLEAFMAPVRAELREGSVISMQTISTVEVMDMDELWVGLRRELEDFGISPQLLNEKKDFIVSWFRTAIAEGTLEEMPHQDEETLPLPTLTTSPVYHTSKSPDDKNYLSTTYSNMLPLGRSAELLATFQLTTVQHADHTEHFAKDHTEHTEKWFKDRFLGQGSFGRVWLERESRTKELRAVKIVDLGTKARIDPVRELHALAQITNVQIPRSQSSSSKTKELY
jgi:hypothetical protein